MIKNCSQLDLETFLKTEANILIANGCLDKAIDYVFDTIDKMLWNSEFEKIDAILSQVCVQDTHLDILIALLSITLAAKTKLKARNKFYLDIKDDLSLTEPPERLKGLLSGLD